MPAIELNCPSCEARLRVREQAVAKELKCPRCHKPFTVPDGSVEVVTVAPRPKQPVVFVSHATEDRAFVEGTLKPLLQGHGIQVWWSQEDIRGGEEWQKTIRKAVQEADWFLLVMSPRSEDSDWVKREIRWAMADKPQRILPVLVKKCVPEEFHPRLPKLQLLDFTADAEAAGRKLLADMIQKLHHQTREQSVKVEEISKQSEELKEQVVEADRRKKELAVQVQSVLRFDGTFTHAPARNAPPFRPLEERQAPIVAVLNLKGGVGKTTLTANLGASLWSQDPKQRVLLVDLDYQANLSLNCIGRTVLGRLSRQRRLVQELFFQDAADPMLAVRCIEPVFDDNHKTTEGWILACDSNLNVEESRALMRWLVGTTRSDLRYILRAALHAEAVQAEYDLILIDCPPRLTPGCVNALVACDYLLVPVILDEKSTEGPPPLLKWIWDRRQTLDLQMREVGLVANKVRHVNREEGEWADLLQQCRDRWGGSLHGFASRVSLFPEGAMERKFAACFADMRNTFVELGRELRTRLQRVPAEVAS